MFGPSLRIRAFKPYLECGSILVTPTDDKMTADSITAQDGSYYIGDVRPGKYYLLVDTATVLQEYVITDEKRIIEVAPAKEYQQVTTPPFLARLR
jgi:hypothetical protein